MRIGLAFRVFFAALFDAAVAERLQHALLVQAPVAEQPKPPDRKLPEPKPIAAAKPATRSDALTLLSALQREARLLDLVQEPLGSYCDAQIGAAARDVIRNSAAVLDRWFALRPLLEQEEGSSVEVPAGYDPQRFRLVGTVSGDPPFRGQLVHHGWLATKCELPDWSGNSESARVVSPVEVEVGARG
jgi:hypothetical protein